MKKVLFITDLDGTLLNSAASLNETTINILNRLLDDGLLFTYATARSFVSARPITKSLRLNIPVITYNGVFIVSPDYGSILESCTMDKQDACWALDAISARGLYPLVYGIVDASERVSWIDGREGKGILNYLKSRSGDRRLRPVTDYSSLFHGDIFYITFIGTMKEMAPVYELFMGRPNLNCVMSEDVYKKGEMWVEIYCKDARKDVAAHKLKALTGVERIICFGDNLNDLPLFLSCDERYAVGNAIAEVKEAATAIIGTNNEDGVARWIDTYITNHS